MIPLTSRDSRPVWDQVTDGLASLLRRGAFLPGESLPPPEELAWQMVLNPGAVRRAYETLAQQGILVHGENAAWTVAERRGEP